MMILSPSACIIGILLLLLLCYGYDTMNHPYLPIIRTEAYTMVPSLMSISSSSLVQHTRSCRHQHDHQYQQPSHMINTNTHIQHSHRMKNGILVASLVLLSSSSSELETNHETIEQNTTSSLQQSNDIHNDDTNNSQTQGTTITTTESTNDHNNNNHNTIQQNLSFLQSLGAITGRGEYMIQSRYTKKTQQQYDAVRKVVQELEVSNPIIEPSTSIHIVGTWELLYSTTELFYQSPFFMAGRAICTSKEAIQQYQWFCHMHREALSISTIQSVRQIIALNQQLISEFEVKVGSIPFLSNFIPFIPSYSGGLPTSITGAIVSTADISSVQNNTGFEIYMDTVQIKGSNIPLIRQLLDNQNMKLYSRQLSNVLQRTISSYKTPPKPIFRITYLDDQYRICRDMDDNIYVYVKTSNSTTTSSKLYDTIDSDLGIGRLLEGFNDAITKIYI